MLVWGTADSQWSEGEVGRVEVWSWTTEEIESEMERRRPRLGVRDVLLLLSLSAIAALVERSCVRRSSIVLEV